MPEKTKKSQSIISLTDAAAKKVYELISVEENSPQFLRVFISGMGCSGFRYGFTFEEKSDQNDEIIECQHASDNVKHTVNILIDPASLPFLKGASIDYQTENGERFVVDNPNANKGGCSSCSGCGE